MRHAGLHCLAELHVLDLFGDDVQGSDQRDASRHHGGELPRHYGEVFFAWIFLERLDVDFSVETGACGEVHQFGGDGSHLGDARHGLIARVGFDGAFHLLGAIERDALVLPLLRGVLLQWRLCLCLGHGFPSITEWRTKYCVNMSKVPKASLASDTLLITSNSQNQLCVMLPVAES